MYGPPRLDHILSDLLYGRPRINARIQNLSDLVKGSTQVDRSWPGEEEMVEEKFDVIAQLEGRSQKFRSWILGQGGGDIRCYRQTSQGTDGRCPSNLSKPDKRSEINQPRPLRCSVTYLHGFDSFIRLLDGIDLDPFLGVRKQELVNDLNPVTRSPDRRDGGHRPNQRPRLPDQAKTKRKKRRRGRKLQCDDINLSEICPIRDHYVLVVVEFGRRAQSY